MKAGGKKKKNERGYRKTGELEPGCGKSPGRCWRTHHLRHQKQKMRGTFNFFFSQVYSFTGKECMLCCCWENWIFSGKHGNHMQPYLKLWDLGIVVLSITCLESLGCLGQTSGPHLRSTGLKYLGMGLGNQQLQLAHWWLRSREALGLSGSLCLMRLRWQNLPGMAEKGLQKLNEIGMLGCIYHIVCTHLTPSHPLLHSLRGPGASLFIETLRNTLVRECLQGWEALCWLFSVGRVWCGRCRRWGGFSDSTGGGGILEFQRPSDRA